MESSNTHCILSKIFTIPIYLWGEDPYAEMQMLNLNQIQLHLKGRTQTHTRKTKGKKLLLRLFQHIYTTSSPSCIFMMRSTAHPMFPVVLPLDFQASPDTCKRLSAYPQICIYCSLCSFTPSPGSNIPHLPPNPLTCLVWARQSRARFSLPFCQWGH